jgi:phosphate transport system substrate-binding protein
MLAPGLILLVIALTVGSAVLSAAGSRQGKDLPPATIPLHGAGSTFAAPLYKTWLENKAGQLIQPHGGSGLATLLNIQMPENFRAFAPDPDGEDSYPIVTYSWLLLYQRYNNPQKVAALKAYVAWCLIDGQEFSESLGFVRLPPRVATRAVHALDGIE